MSTKQKRIATAPQLGQSRYNEPKPARIAAQAQPVRARKRNRYRARRIPWLAIALLVIGVAFVGAIVASGTLQAAPQGTIAATGATSYDFGTVPMKGGNITTRFPITVQGDARAIDITSSWMCTKGRLVQADRSTDWLGMVMTSPDIPVSFDLKGGEPAYLEVSIDPAAHGEAGLGPIQRGVEVKLAGGQVFAVTLTATIVK